MCLVIDIHLYRKIFDNKMRKLTGTLFSFIMLPHLAVQNNGKYYIKESDYTEGVYTYFPFSNSLFGSLT